MWIHDVAPERLAELFHHYHQALRPGGPDNPGDGRGSWTEVPQKEKNRLVAAARLALLELESTASERQLRHSILPSREKQNGVAERAFDDRPAMTAGTE